MVFILLVIVILCAIAAGITDYRSLRIPNILPGIILLCFIIGILVDPEFFSPWYAYVGAGGIMLVVTFIMFAVKMIGGGDSKLAVALGLWVGFKGLPVLIFVMAFVGGLLGVVALVVKKRKPFANPLPGGWVDQVQGGRSAVPYGIAITLGAIAALWLTGGLSYQFEHFINKIT